MVKSGLARLLQGRSVVSKRWKGKTCVYCTVPESSTTADHVIARGFFPVDKRSNLPQVPACGPCNGRKSELEHYLSSVLPFGSTTADAHKYLEEFVAPRLEKNQRLARELSAGMDKKYALVNGRVLQAAMTIPFDSEKVLELFKFIAQGLAYVHWDVLLPASEVLSFAEFLIPQGAGYLEAMLNTTACISTGRVSLGDGVFTYQGVRDPVHRTLTVWRMSMYGVVAEAEANGNSVQVSNAYAMTSPRGLKAATELMAMWSHPVAA
jgi:hypothetical protein